MIGELLCQLIRIFSGANARWLIDPRKERQRIYFANHSSHLDAFVLWAVLPTALRQMTRVVGAKEYWEKTAWRRFIHRQYRPILIERNRHFAGDDPAHPIRQMATALAQGSSIVLFPEGTRNAEEGIKPFKSGLYHLAKARPDVDLVPVYLENLNRILPKGEIFLVPMMGSVTFGAPLHLDPQEDKLAFLNRAQQALRQLEEI